MASPTDYLPSQEVLPSHEASIELSFDKYGEGTWITRNHEEAYNAILRHLSAWKDRSEIIDPETRVPHMASVSYHARRILQLDRIRADSPSLPPLEKSDWGEP
jgi:hypothetical protein